MIEAKKINKSFGENIIFKDFNVKLEEGEIYGLTGRNGAGKSTLIKILSGNCLIDSGLIEIDNNIIEESSYSYKNNLGVLFDKSLLIEKFTALEFFDFTATLRKVKSKETDRLVQELIEVFFLREEVDKYIDKCSKGTQKKIEILSTLLHNPRYWFLDEPFEGLDVESIINLKKIIISKSKIGHIILIASHQQNHLENIITKNISI